MLDFKQWFEVTDEMGRKVPVTDRLEHLRKTYGGKGYFGSFTEKFGDKKQSSPLGHKLGINPQSDYDTPIGIYCYPFDYILDKGVSGVPFVHDKPAIIVFKTKPGANIVQMDDDQESTDQSSLYLTADEIQHYNANHQQDYTHRSNASVLWLATKEQATQEARRGEVPQSRRDVPQRRRNPAVLWTKNLMDRGIQGFVDNGTGTIHENEPTQAVFFTTAAVEIVDVIDNIWSGQGNAFNFRWKTNKLYTHLTQQLKLNKRNPAAEKALLGYDKSLSSNPDTAGESGLSIDFAKLLVSKMRKNFLYKKKPEHVGNALRQYIAGDFQIPTRKDPYLRNFDPEALKDRENKERTSVQMAYSRLLNDTYRRFQGSHDIEGTMRWMDQAIDTYIDIAIEHDQQRYKEGQDSIIIDFGTPIRILQRGCLHKSSLPPGQINQILDSIKQKHPEIFKYAPQQSKFHYEKDYYDALVKYLQGEQGKENSIEIRLFVPTLTAYQLDSIAGELHKKQPAIMKGAPWRSNYPTFDAYWNSLRFYFDRLGYDLPDIREDQNIISYEFNKKVLETLAKKIVGKEWWKTDSE